MFDQEAIEQGFPEEFPMGPEPERKDLIDRSIDKGKDFLEYLTTPSKHGVFNQGGDVAAQTDNLFGYTDKAVTKEVDKYKEDVNTELSFKDVATFVAEATPIIGDALAAKEIYDELQKDDPNYLLVGALGGAALVGLIPGLGDAAASVIKTGAKKALDTAKRIEVDPNALGSMGGNINLTPKAANSPDEPKNYAYRTDNPATKGYEGGEEWLESKQKTAEDRAKNSSEENSTGKLLSGSITGYMGQDFKRPLFLSTEMLSKLKGANDEKRYVGEGRYDLLRKRVDKEGFDPEQKYSSEDDYGNAIVIGVNHKGEAFIIEGNTRVAVAKDLDVPSIRAEVKYYNGAEEVDGPYSPQNIIQYADKPKDFNKGGAVMNEQMEMAFMQQGGLKDDGMKRDPVSGNEVPNGSMAKEVRDDIPAQLSEGEYVVPADVVRYLGVKHFEDLRDKAKQGLQSMEANGRIGGEPVPAGGPQAAPMMQPPMPQAPTPQMAMGGDLSPEEMNEINSIMMAQGGMIPADPYQQQQMQYTQPMAQGAAEGADFSFYKPPEGVSIEEAITTPGKPGGGRYTGEFSFEQPPAPIATVPALPPVVVETPATCEARGMVYNPETKLCEMPAPIPRVESDGGSKDEDKTAADPNAWMDSYNYTDVQSILDSSTKALEGPESGTFGALVNRVFGGGIFGVLGQAGTAAQIAANVKILESIGATEEAATLKGKLDGFVKSNDLGWIPGFMIDGDQLAAGATSKLNIENLTEHYGAQKRMDKATTAAFGAARAKELSEKYGETVSKDPSASGFTSGYLEAMTTPERKKLTEELTKTAEEKREEFKASQPAQSARDDDYSAADMMRDQLDKKSESGKFQGSVTSSSVYAGGNRAEGGLMLKKKKKK